MISSLLPLLLISSLMGGNRGGFGGNGMLALLLAPQMAIMGMLMNKNISTQEALMGAGLMGDPGKTMAMISLASKPPKRRFKRFRRRYYRRRY